MKQTAINIPIFDQNVVVIWGENLENLLQYVEDTEGVIQKSTVSVDAITIDYRDGRIFICLTNSASDYVIVHECVHAVYALINLVSLDLKDEEIFAYLLEYLYKEIKKYV